VLFGTGISIAFFKWFTDRSDDVNAIRIVPECTVVADWLLTTPAVIIQTITGFGLAYLASYPMLTAWLFYTLCLYLFAGCCWLPVVRLQIRMREMPRTTGNETIELPQLYWRYARIWFGWACGHSAR
jgi:uncharacterized membrane protein